MRDYGAGQLRKSEGYWQFFVEYRDNFGNLRTSTQITDLEATDDNRVVASERLLKWRDSLIAEDVAKDVANIYEAKLAALEKIGVKSRANPTLNKSFEEYAKVFINNKKLSRSSGKPLENATKLGYLMTLEKQVLPYLPNGVLVSEITPQMVEEMLYDLQIKGKYSASTVKKAFNLMRSILTYAVEHDGLNTNVCDGLRAPTKSKPRLNVLSVDKVPELASELAGMSQSIAVTSARLALNCGLRVGEIAALKLRDCNDKTGFIDIHAAIGRTNKPSTNEEGRSYLKAPKTDAGVRQIPINDEVKDIISSRKRVIIEELVQSDVLAISGNIYLVGDFEGHWTTPNNIGKQWTTLSKAMDLRGSLGKTITLHDLRHTFATYALAKGANPKDVQAIMGHSSIQMTMDVYAASDPSEQVAMMQLIAQ